MPAFSDLDQRWWLLVPPEAVVLRAAPRREVLRQVRALPSRTTVALLGGRRPRLLAWRGRLRVGAVYVALPSVENPVAITQHQTQALRFTARNVLTVPSGVTRLHLPIWVAVRLVRALPGLLGRTPVGDRLVLGVRR